MKAVNNILPTPHDLINNSGFVTTFVHSHHHRMKLIGKPVLQTTHKLVKAKPLTSWFCFHGNDMSTIASKMQELFVTRNRITKSANEAQKIVGK